MDAPPDDRLDLALAIAEAMRLDEKPEYPEDPEDQNSESENP
jgi:hypothetical protein